MKNVYETPEIVVERFDGYDIICSFGFSELPGNSIQQPDPSDDA